MNPQSISRPYHHYLFFQIEKTFFILESAQQKAVKEAFQEIIAKHSSLLVDSFSTLGFKAQSSFMLWCRADTPDMVQEFLRDVLHTPAGQHFTLAHSLFGISKPSPYSGRTGKPEQDMTLFETRKKFFVVYPFTKTHAWYQLDLENRRSIMGQHIKTGIEHPNIRQCLLYSFGVDDQEFIVSYEMDTLEEFQEVVQRMRSTLGRVYTHCDTPLFTAVHRPLPELLEWL